MSFAAVTNVSLKGRDRTDAEKFLNEVMIPTIKTLPGFETARFLRSTDGTTGVGAVVFDSESNARAGLDAMIAGRPAEAPPVESTAIYELIVEV
jgi:heme-degrading monooxygenase HmoA